MKTITLALAAAALTMSGAVLAQQTPQAAPDATQTNMPQTNMAPGASTTPPAANDPMGNAAAAAAAPAAPMAPADAAPASDAPKSYPTCSRTVHDECRNRGGV
jgi:hypothetical protein